ncbi:MAG: hypothetical protein EOO59_04625, partial [Hymenobacter sp.]
MGQLLGKLLAAARRQIPHGRKLPVEVEPVEAPAVVVGVGAVQVQVFAAVVERAAAHELAIHAPAVAGIQAAIGAQALVFFELDVDNARAALRVVASGRAGNQVDTLNLVGRQGILVVLDGKRVPLTGTDLADYLRALPAD